MSASPCVGLGASPVDPGASRGDQPPRVRPPARRRDHPRTRAVPSPPRATSRPSISLSSVSNASMRPTAASSKWMRWPVRTRQTRFGSSFHASRNSTSEQVGARSSVSMARTSGWPMYGTLPAVAPVCPTGRVGHAPGSAVRQGRSWFLARVPGRTHEPRGGRTAAPRAACTRITFVVLRTVWGVPSSDAAPRRHRGRGAVTSVDRTGRVYGPRPACP